MRSVNYTCDVCGVIKGESNHWYKIRIVGAFHTYTWSCTKEGASEPDERIHVCGRACAQKKYEEWLEAQK